MRVLFFTSYQYSPKYEFKTELIKFKKIYTYFYLTKSMSR